MAFKIVSVEEANAAIERNVADNIRRLDLDLSDCALSVWGSQAAIGAFRAMIAAWELGKDLGADCPCAVQRVLCRGNEIVSNRMIENQYGRSWLVADGIEGRKFFPVGSKSRIQKQYGLEERELIVEADDYLDSDCAGIGMPVWYGAKAKIGGRVFGFSDEIWEAV